MDTNKCELSGVIDRLKSVHTKSGKPMAAFTLKCQNSWFKISTFGNVASHILDHAKDGDLITVSGSLSNERWKTEEGTWRDSFEIKAWSIELHGEKVAFQRGQAQRSGKGKSASPSSSAGKFRPAPDSIPTPPPGAYF